MSSDFPQADECPGVSPLAGAGNPQCKVAIVMCRGVAEDTNNR